MIIDSIIHIYKALSYRGQERACSIKLNLLTIQRSLFLQHLGISKPSLISEEFLLSLSSNIIKHLFTSLHMFGSG